MDCFSLVATSANGRPVMLNGESVKIIQEGVAIYEPGTPLISERMRVTGLLTLTTHRLLWIRTDQSLTSSGGGGVLMSLLLGMVVKEPECRGGVPPFTHNKIVVSLPENRSVFLSFRLNSSAAVPFHQLLTTVLEQRLWVNGPGEQTEKETSQTQNSTKSQGVFSTSRAGIGGLMRAQEIRHRSDDHTLKQAFSDLNVLMERAKDVVSLAERLGVALEKQEKDKDGGAELRKLLMSMGISNPVTKEATGSAFHVHLARELAESLSPAIDAAGGMMALTDAYCLANRARGTELISPDDMVAACALLEPLGLAIRLRTFDSGVMILYTIYNTDEIVIERLKRLCTEHGSLSVADLATKEGVSVIVAEEQLLLAEKKGLLCRDETVHEVRFWNNIFV